LTYLYSTFVPSVFPVSDSSITSLKQNGQLGTPEQLGDDTVFQLTEWQKHADMLRFLGDVKERTDIADQMDDFSSEIGLTLKVSHFQWLLPFGARIVTVCLCLI
jgi:hypothetical protein